MISHKSKDQDEFIRTNIARISERCKAYCQALELIKSLLYFVIIAMIECHLLVQRYSLALNQPTFSDHVLPRLLRRF